jgi:hypothetical protein
MTKSGMPPRNPLAAASRTGKRPRLHMKQMLIKMRERERLKSKGKAHGVLSLAGIERAQLLPTDPREAARQALIGRDPRAQRGRIKAKKMIQKAKQSAAEAAQRAAENDAYLATFAAPAETTPEPAAATTPTNRPPRIEAGRYGGLKDGRPG